MTERASTSLWSSSRRCSTATCPRRRLRRPNSPQSVNARNGALIGLAGVAIALGIEIAPYLQTIVPPILVCFADPDSKIRYFACESFYNIAKVCKGEILMYFNETFDALSRLAADSELSVKNGAELLDRLLKDIVCEAAPHYVFSLARFVPLLAERMYVLSPFTRNYLVSWVTVLDSVPDLELVSFLPSFLDGLLKYLSDPNTDVRVATANVLADFLREIREAAEVARIRGEAEARRAQKENEKQAQSQERVAAVDEGAEEEKREADGEEGRKDGAEELEEKNETLEEATRTGCPRQKRRDPGNDAAVDRRAPRRHQGRRGALCAQADPRHPAQPGPPQPGDPDGCERDECEPVPSRAVLSWATSASPSSQPDTESVPLAKQKERAPPSQGVASPRVRSSSNADDVEPITGALGISIDGTGEGGAGSGGEVVPNDPFDLQTTVNVLTLQLIDEHEETRVTALEWLLMLHQKAPPQNPVHRRRYLSCAPQDALGSVRGSHQVRLAPAGPDVGRLRRGIQLVPGQPRELVQHRPPAPRGTGKPHHRQLCTSLHTGARLSYPGRDPGARRGSRICVHHGDEPVDDPHHLARVSDFRKRLKNLDSKDGSQLFNSLYRSWCHNAVATFSLCLLAQAYEHAANLLPIFAELEMTVGC
ncbi:hypothetical protein L7F22_018704 [Adiantum nelumboides]|nr:hypothetical protein [Adiantum nelumboides]